MAAGSAPLPLLVTEEIGLGLLGICVMYAVSVLPLNVPARIPRAPGPLRAVRGTMKGTWALMTPERPDSEGWHKAWTRYQTQHSIASTFLGIHHFLPAQDHTLCTTSRFEGHILLMGDVFTPEAGQDCRWGSVGCELTLILT